MRKAANFIRNPSKLYMWASVSCHQASNPSGILWHINLCFPQVRAWHWPAQQYGLRAPADWKCKSAEHVHLCAGGCGSPNKNQFPESDKHPKKVKGIWLYFCCTSFMIMQVCQSSGVRQQRDVTAVGKRKLGGRQRLCYTLRAETTVVQCSNYSTKLIKTAHACTMAKTQKIQAML